MEFKKNKYVVIRKAISKELATFIFNYILIKRQVAKTLFETKSISPFSDEYGKFGDLQVPDTYAHYSDIVMDTLLLKCQDIMEKNTDLKLLPTYTYTRIYKNGDILKRHKDRPSCEISTTLFLGGDKWPIYLEPSGEVGKKGTKINLNPGDMLVYKGCELEHWREKFEGEDCAQVFLHYNRDTEENQKNIYDSKPHIGLPSFFRKNGV
jgi:hypothetical protein